MSYRRHILVTAIDCDVRGCEATVQSWENLPYDQIKARAHLDEIAKADGWSKWGGRSWRLYCPKHGPRGGPYGTRLHLVFGNDVNNALAPTETEKQQ